MNAFGPEFAPWIECPIAPREESEADAAIPLSEASEMRYTGHALSPTAMA